MQLFNHYHRNQLSRLIHKDFWLYEFSVWIHTFARALISVFIPILLLKLGYSVTEVIIYYFIYNGFDSPLNFVARWLIKTIGARWTIILSTLASIGFFIGLYNLTAGNWPLLILIALLDGIYDSFYWVGHLYVFMTTSKNDDDVSKDASFLYVVRKIAQVVAPIIGAIVLIFTGQHILIILSIIILFLSIIPLFKIKNLNDKPDDISLGFKKFFNSWDDIKDFGLKGLHQIHNASEDIIWPIFIFTIFGTIESVAILPVIISLTTITFTLYIGKINKTKRGRAIALGSGLIALVWILRLLITNNVFYYGTVFLIGLLNILISLPVDSNIFEKEKAKGAINVSTFRNFTDMFVNFLFFGFLLILLNVFNVSFLSAAVCLFVIMALAGNLFKKKKPA